LTQPEKYALSFIVKAAVTFLKSKHSSSASLERFS